MTQIVISETQEALTRVHTRRFRPYPQYEDSGIAYLQEIPARWTVKRLKYATELVNEKINAGTFVLSYLGLEDIECWTGRILQDNRVSEVDGVSNSFKKGDVHFGKLRPYLAKVHHAQMDGVCTSELLVMRKRDLEPRFLMYHLLNPAFITQRLLM